MKSLKYLRIAYALSAKDMAVLLDISPAHYSRLEKGTDRKASSQLIIKASKVFAVSPCLLFCHELKGTFAVCTDYCVIGRDIIAIDNIHNAFKYDNIKEKVQNNMKKTPRRADLLKIIEEKLKDRE